MTYNLPLIVGQCVVPTERGVIVMCAGINDGV